MFKSDNFFNKDNPIFSEIFKDTEYVWEGLNNIERFLNKNLSPNLPEINGPLVKNTIELSNGSIIYEGAYIIGEDIQLGEGVKIEPGAYVAGPTIIGDRTEIRQGAYIRGKVITGPDCVIGHTTEIKNSIMLEKSKAGHFAYIGDSILGSVNLGAGTKLANLKLTGSNIEVKYNGKTYNTGLRKFGAILGDGVQTGCNCVTAPGTIMSKEVLTYPNSSARGFYKPRTIVKLNQNIEKGSIK